MNIQACALPPKSPHHPPIPTPPRPSPAPSGDVAGGAGSEPGPRNAHLQPMAPCSLVVRCCHTGRTRSNVSCFGATRLLVCLFFCLFLPFFLLSLLRSILLPSLPRSLVGWMFLSLLFPVASSPCPNPRPLVPGLELASRALGPRALGFRA